MVFSRALVPKILHRLIQIFRSYGSYGFLIAANLCALWAFLPEFAAGPNQFNDLALHGGILQQMQDSLSSGGSIFDFWFDASPFGYPLFRVYQSLPHLIMFATFKAFGEFVPIWMTIIAFTTSLACLLPWSVYFLTRKLGFSPWPAACAGFLSVLLSEVQSHGMGMSNYSWGTLGLVTQLWGVVFLAPALAFVIDYLRTGRHLGLSLAFIFLSCGSHLLCAYLLAVITSCVVVALVVFKQRGVAGSARGASSLVTLSKRLGALGVGGICVTSHQWVTLMLDAPYVHRSIYEPTWKFSSYGIEWSVTNLLQGALFDNSRFPSISLMVAGGVVVSLWDIVARSYPFSRVRAATMLLSFGALFSLLCGVELWGVTGLFSLPVFNAMHLHRMIVGVQLVGLLLAAAFIERLLSFKLWIEVVIAALLVALVPVLQERHARFAQTHSWIANAQPSSQMQGDVDSLIDELRAAPRGWVFAGRAADSPFKIAPSMPLFYRLTIEGIPTLGMLFHSMSLAADVMFLFEPEDSFTYRALGVRYVVQPDSWSPPAFLQVRKRFDSFVLYEYPESGVVDVGTIYPAGSGSHTARAEYNKKWFTSERVRQGSYGEIFATDSAAAMRGLQFVDALSGDVDQSEAVALRGAVVSSRREQHFVTSEVQLEQSGIVVFKVGYHPRWIAHVDGQRVQTRWVTPGFLAVDLPPGRHQVQARYEPWRGKGVLLLSCVGLVLGMLRFPRRGRGRS